MTNMIKRKALGRGLSALIPDAPTETAPLKEQKNGLFLCPIEKIHPNKGQPRRYFDEEKLLGLVASIREHGIVQPLIVRPIEHGDRYELVAGERRWRAAQKAGLHEVPVVIREYSGITAFEAALVENIQRADLNPIEEAEAYRKLIEDHQLTQDTVARRVGKDRSTITNSLRLLKLPDSARRALIAGSISTGHARALLALDDPALIHRSVETIVARQLSVRQTEALVKTLQERTEHAHETTDSSATEVPSSNVRHLEERLSRALSTRVRVVAGKKGTQQGRLEINYNSLDELDRLLEFLIR